MQKNMIDYFNEVTKIAGTDKINQVLKKNNSPLAKYMPQNSAPSNSNATEQEPALIRKTSIYDDDAEELTPAGEAAFREGFASVNDEDEQSNALAKVRAAVKEAKTPKGGDVLRKSVQNQKGDPNEPLIVQKLPYRPGNAQPEVVKYFDFGKANYKPVNDNEAQEENSAQLARNEFEEKQEISKMPKLYFYPKQEIPKIPNTYLHPKYEPPQPGTENEWAIPKIDDIRETSAAYERANQIIDAAYYKQYDWLFEGSDLGFSPYEVSELDIAEDRVDGAVGRTSIENAVRGLLTSGLDLYVAKGKSLFDKSLTQVAEETIKEIPKDILKEKAGIPSFGDIVNDSIPQLTKHSIENAEKYLDYVNQQDRKYLIHNRWTRNKFIEQLERDIKEIENTNKFGFLSQDESDAFKEQLLQRLRRIVDMNRNYEYEKAILDKEWGTIKNRWGKEFPPIMTDPKYSF